MAKKRNFVKISKNFTAIDYDGHLILRDLIKKTITCITCNELLSMGKEGHAVWAEVHAHNSHDVTESSSLPRRCQCPTCSGRGWLSENEPFETCPVCDGLGLAEIPAEPQVTCGKVNRRKVEHDKLLKPYKANGA